MSMFGVAFAVYTLFIVGVGIYSARYARRSDEDYFLAGRSLGPWVAALSASASSESGWVTLGLVGWAYSSGVSAYWIIPGCCLGFLFNWLIVAGRLRTHSEKIGALTIPDLFSMHFKERLPLLRILSVLVILVAMLLYVAAQFAAAGKAFNVIFEMQYAWGVVIGALIVLIYVLLGGFRAACWTDFVQGIIMVGALVAFPIYLLLSRGGFGFIADQIEPVNNGELLRFIPSAARASGPALLGFLLGSGAMGINFGYPGQPHVLVRFMALKDKRSALPGAAISVVWAICIYWGAVTVGLMARALAETGAEWTSAIVNDGEVSLVVSAIHMIPGIFSGLVLAAVLAAICSTADSQLVVAASSAASDIYATLISHTRDASHLLVNRLTVLVMTLLAVALVLIPEMVQGSDRLKVFEYVLTYGWAILGAAFGPQVILLLFWKRASYAGCLAGMAVGFVLPILWKLWYMDDGGWLRELLYSKSDTYIEIYNLPLGFVCALAANVAFSLLMPGKADGSDSDPMPSA